MRVLLFLFAVVSSVAAAPPPELTEALKTFRSDGPRGWAYTQATSAEGKSLVERFDPAQREPTRWTLLQRDGHAPTPDELRDYTVEMMHGVPGTPGPKLTEQFDLGTLETVSATPERATYRCRLKPGEKGDETSAFLRVTLVMHKSTQTIESVELANMTPFTPTFGVKIVEMKTTMTYTLPTADRPSLLDKITTRLRGKAFWVKSLDADMLVTFTDYAKAGKQ